MKNGGAGLGNVTQLTHVYSLAYSFNNHDANRNQKKKKKKKGGQGQKACH